MIHHGDLFDVLPTLAAASIDACVTDPPYGIGFMGKEWDSFKPGVAATRIVPNRAKESDNPNLKGRNRGPASSPSAVEYNRSLEGQKGFQEWTSRWAGEVFRLLKPGAYIVVCGAPRSFHRMTCGLEDAGFEIRDCLSWLYGQGFPKSLNVGDGRGTALKPSWEPCVLGRKPFKGNLKGNLAAHGTGALNIDACRIEGDVPKPGGLIRGKRSPFDGANDSGATELPPEPNPLGRWPANVLIDADAAEMLNKQTGDLGLSSGNETQGEAHPNGIYGSRIKQGRVEIGYLDSGGASRFYYVAKPSREERDYGCEGLRARTGGEACEDRAEGSAGLSNPRAGAGRTGGSRNVHPTVKPVELMRWLVKLVTPIGGTVLDPFGGSGTTAMACRYEQRPYIIVEREAEYVEIIKRRVGAVAPLFGETA